MSLKLAKKTLFKFVETPVPEVVCLKGKWGVGKTYAWKQLLEEAILKGKVALSSYAYVSLFGVNSIDELRQAIFENNNLTKTATPSLEEKLKEYRRIAAQNFSKYVHLVKIPYVDTYVQNLAGGFRHLVSLTVNNSIICIDDFERKGKSLRAADILGVVSQLKEAKNCKILLILNKDALPEDDKKEFDKYFEKVIDAVVDFEPTALESLEIALKRDDEVSGWLRLNCADLGISNIRVIKKIERLAVQVEGILQPFSQQLRKEVIRSLTVLAWSAYSGEDAPPIQFLLKRRVLQNLGADKDVKMTEEESGWNNIINVYGFTHCDDLDRILIDGIHRGFMDEERVNAEAAKIQAQYDASVGEAALTAAWGRFHHSFNSDEGEVAQQLFEGSMKNIKYLGVHNLNAAIVILKDIGEEDKASRLLGQYLIEMADEPQVFDPARNPFLSSDMTDPDLIAAFNQQALAAAPPHPSPIEACQRLRKNDWSQGNQGALETLTVEEFIALFKSLEGDELSSTVFGALSFRKIGNPTPVQKTIAAKVEEALTQIASESALNLHRMKKYRV
jgi:hypothetical protein